MQQNMLIWLLKKTFMLTSSGKQSSNNCEHITQWRKEMSILLILNILNWSTSFEQNVNKVTRTYILFCFCFTGQCQICISSYGVTFLNFIASPKLPLYRNQSNLTLKSHIDLRLSEISYYSSYLYSTSFYIVFFQQVVHPKNWFFKSSKFIPYCAWFYSKFCL